jgi:hypothetical protein
VNLFDFLRDGTIEDLNLPASIFQKLLDQNQTDFLKLYSCVQSFQVFGKYSIEDITTEEMLVIKQKYFELMATNGLMKPKDPPTSSLHMTTNSGPTALEHHKPTYTSRPISTIPKRELEEKKYDIDNAPQRNYQNEYLKKIPDPRPGPLTSWEERLEPKIKLVELIGEIEISKEDLGDISLHLNSLFNSHSEQAALNAIERYYPVCFLVFMVGQGIYGYKDGDFWSAYEKVLHISFDHTSFGRLFEKLLQRFGKPQFRDLQEKSMRYVSLILAHGGIPVYCLKDFFNNIVLNCATRSQLIALEGQELAEEVLKHSSLTTNTDKPVLYFLEYGGTTASNLLDRARKMLLVWQQNQTLISSLDAGLPAHITQYFAEWTRENSNLSIEHGSRNRLKRPRISLDPWGLGIFLYLPPQTVSAIEMGDLFWKVDAGNLHEEIKARTQNKRDQIETREITFRLNEVAENIQVQFSQGGNNFDWKITGFSSDHLILAFDPISGQIQNHILARETWLLYPNHLSLTLLAGEGTLLEVLPELPGEWSNFKLECWDLSQSIRLGLAQHGETICEIYVRSQEKIELPTLIGGNIITTDLEENPIPLYSGFPPTLRIPLGSTDDILTELSRWEIKIDNENTADPEVDVRITLAELSEENISIVDNTALIRLDASSLLTNKPIGTYKISIKGPLGRDADLALQILPECEISGLRDLYIPDRDNGPEAISFSIHTSLFAGVDSFRSEDGIKIEAEKPGTHNIFVPAEMSSVGLLIRRETINHQFIRLPIYLRFKRLRWRMVDDNGLVENWIQKHISMSLQKLLQQNSPLLIVDLPPGNEDGNLELELNLLDIQGNIIQQLKPADRSIKRVTRFWRFDLSKIKHLLEMNDSPIFRLDLVGTREKMGENEFNLPVMVFTRDIHIMGLNTVVYSSSDQHLIHMSWMEKEQLRSRALILWSLFRPWQVPIIENIPDSACGEYEFSISRKNHAEGLYKLQMFVIDPWTPFSPPSLSPNTGNPGCYEIELSSPQESLKKLESNLIAKPFDKSLRFCTSFEISLIKQYLGEMDASNHDLEVCCHNLISASARELLTLRSILDEINSAMLDREFGEQIIKPEILNKLQRDLDHREITLSEILSILSFVPQSKSWTRETCEILVKIEDPKIRFGALVQYVAIDIKSAIDWVLLLLKESKLTFEDAVELLYEEKHTVIEQISKMEGNPTADLLLDFLRRYNPYSGLPIVDVGSWALTNAGWGRIEEILNPQTRISINSFIEGKGKYILSFAMHIYESRDLTGEKAIIDMSKDEITFPKANRLFICQHCQDFVTAKLDIYKSHLAAIHGNALPYPGEHKTAVNLTQIQFNMSPHQS